jgi:hypothetical protein
MDVRIVEVPLGADLKIHLDQRLDALGKQLDDIAAAVRELPPGRND